MQRISKNLQGKIDTFLFFDLETTDLIRGTKMPRITELAMIATSRKSLKPDTKNKLALPRVLHKLCIPICPKQLIKYEASCISDLWNDNLDDVKPFDESTYDMIMHFIERLPGTVCFVAHNGNQFDYPIFLSELERIGKTISDKILCIDTLVVFKEFFNNNEPVVQQIIPDVPEGRDEVDEEKLVLGKENKNETLSDDDEWTESLYSVLDEYDQVKPEKKKRKAANNVSNNDEDVLDSVSHGSERSNCISPVNNTQQPLQIANGKPKNFKLCTLHLHMTGFEPENQHHAESDCISMLRCVRQLGYHFLEWADLHALSLNLYTKKNSIARK